MIRPVKEIIFVIVFFLLLTMPVALINWQPGFISETEKRVLTDFPSLSHVRTEGFDAYRSTLISALQDRIGFRSLFIGAAAAEKLYLQRKSPNEQVYIGKDGWYFCTDDYNIELVKDYMIRNKGNSQLFFKQDFHWASLGAYYAYEQLVNKMKAAGVLSNAEPVKIRLVQVNMGAAKSTFYSEVF